MKTTTRQIITTHTIQTSLAIFVILILVHGFEAIVLRMPMR